MLRTERLLLRAVTLEDAADVMNIRNHETVNKYIHGRTLLNNVTESKARLITLINNQANNEVIMWCICTKDNPENVMGSIVYWNIAPEQDTAEIGYELHPEYHNIGYMGEAMQQVLAYGIETMQLKKIVAYTHRDNIASIKLLKNNGFERDLMLEKQHIGKTEPETQAIYALIIK